MPRSGTLSMWSTRRLPRWLRRRSQRCVSRDQRGANTDAGRSSAAHADGWYPADHVSADEAPHDLLTEWWYYTGHLWTADGERYGFEFVVFQANRGVLPPVYAAHFAITDNQTGTFHYTEKTALDASVTVAQGFDLRLGDWSMRGASGSDQLSANLPNYAIQFTAQASKPPALHNSVGYVDFGPAGGSYYYSRTRMALSGTLSVQGQPSAVTGEAWMDHQWGNFIAVGAGGWDWYSVQLDDGQDLTLSVIHDADRKIVGAYGTLVDATGVAHPLEAADLLP